MGAFASKGPKYFSEFERVEVPPLTGKVVAITGCTTGTGFIAAQCAARKGAQSILMLNRPSERSTAAELMVKEQIPKDGTTSTVVETIPCDLQDTESVQEAIRIIKSKYEKIDVLCNNAGVMGLEDVATKDGYDIQMQTNHLSHFLLTKELFPLVQKSTDGRIVNHSSLARHGSPLEAKYLEKNGGNLGGNGNNMFNGARFVRYHQTKLANACFTAALAARIAAAGITNVKSVCAAPGLSKTNLQITSAASGGMNSNSLIMYMAQTAEDGTMPLLRAMFGTETKNGDFIEPESIGGVYGKAKKVEWDKNSMNKDQQQLLWKKSEEACGKFTM